jgi:hypothetical protein
MFQNLYTSPRRIRWAGNIAWMGEMKNECSILVGKPVRKRPLRRPRRRWNIIYTGS